MRTEHLQQGASFVKVLCGMDDQGGHKGCQDKGGAAWLFFKHKGYDSTNGTEVTPAELSEAEEMAVKHEATNSLEHEVRVVVGHLEGKIKK